MGEPLRFLRQKVTSVDLCLRASTQAAEQKGREEESMNAIRWLGPQSCGERMRPNPGCAWRVEGRTQLPLLLSTRASGWRTVLNEGMNE